MSQQNRWNHDQKPMTPPERRHCILDLLRVRNPMPSAIHVDNAMFLADNGFEVNTISGEWRKRVRDVFILIKPSIVETFTRKDFVDFVRKQEIIANSGRRPNDEGVLIISGEN